ncbi:MAG: cysteine hydrolase family protein [Candidatus Aminicenantales bacterium]
MRPFGILLGLIFLSAAAAAQSGPAQPAALSMERPVLLIIDIQNFYFEGGRIPLAGPVEASLKARAVLEAFRVKKLPVLHVQHMPKGIGKFEPGKTDPQYAIHPNVAPAEGETIVVKHYANAFRETDLASLLKKLGVQTLVITGMQTQMCVEAATRHGADLGYDVVLVGDACAARNLEFGGTVVPAKAVHAAVLAAMNGTYAKVAAASDVLEALK